MTGGPTSGPLAVTVTHAENASTERPPILLVHGAWHGAWFWTQHFTGFLAERGYTSYAVDLRGHGDSPGRLRTSRIAHYVSDVRRVAIELERPPIVIGHSMGGFVTQHYLARHRTAATVLVAPVPVHGAIGATVRVARRHPGAFLRANATWSLGPIVDREDRAMALLFGPGTDPVRARAYARRLGDESYPAYLEMLADLPVPPPDPGPMLVIGGAEDALFSPGEWERTAARYGADLAVVRGLGHDVMLEDAWVEPAGIIADWLDGHAPHIGRIGT